MEEWVGLWWHRCITRLAEPAYPAAAVHTGQTLRVLGTVFRAAGGPAAMNLAAAAPMRFDGPRSRLAKVAGVGSRIDAARCNGEALLLPEHSRRHADPALNRDLLLWLTLLAAHDTGDSDWWRRNQQATRAALATFPGFRGRYLALVEAELSRRPAPAEADATAEQTLRRCLRDPSGEAPATSPRPEQLPFVPLWLYGDAGRLRSSGATAGRTAGEPPAGGRTTQATTAPRLSARREVLPQRKDGLVLPFRAESVLSLAEYVRVDRPAEDDDEGDEAARAARDQDELTLSPGQTKAARLRFDLDLPAAACDDLPLDTGAGDIRLPEWDYRRRQLLPDRCAVQLVVPRDPADGTLPPHLVPLVRRLRRSLDAVRLDRRDRPGCDDGSNIDLDPYLDWRATRAAGITSSPRGCYRQALPQTRDLACLVLADASLSTDAAVDNDQRVIDVIRDSLIVLGEVLHYQHDHFALYAFSSAKRDRVRLTALKQFHERHGAAVRARTAALKPGYYTRLGAAIRYATGELAAQPARQHLLLVLTDGKPNDLDYYEGRFGIEDTHHAVATARRQGVFAHAVAIDRERPDYLHHLFGPGGHTWVRTAARLPALLPAVYARLRESAGR